MQTRVFDRFFELVAFGYLPFFAIGVAICQVAPNPPGIGPARMAFSLSSLDGLAWAGCQQRKTRGWLRPLCRGLYTVRRQAGGRLSEVLFAAVLCCTRTHPKSSFSSRRIKVRYLGLSSSGTQRVESGPEKKLFTDGAVLAGPRAGVRPCKSDSSCSPEYLLPRDSQPTASFSGCLLVISPFVAVCIQAPTNLLSAPLPSVALPPFVGLFRFFM